MSADWAIVTFKSWALHCPSRRFAVARAIRANIRSNQMPWTPGQHSAFPKLGDAKVDLTDNCHI